ncbi:MAG: hypothetical protein MAG431_02279 [Chloroflexi bacterium]|nr:hypothetical protein [Chloroflexota bacterium]
MRTSKRFLFLFIIVLVLGIGASGAHAQTGESRYFPETGHWVEGEFLIKYEGTKDAELVYGNPTTERFLDSVNGIDVQYFERARFELHPNQFPLVQLTPLGELMYEPGNAFSPPPTTQACKRFKSDGPQVCLDFLEFFEAHGGVAQFGYPISTFEMRNERIVQYFQRARFEWHPENSPGQQVVLSNLGLSYFLFRGESLEFLKPSDFIPQMATSALKLHAFPQKPLLPTSGHQTFYIIVKDQYSQPVAGAAVTGLVILPDGQELPLPRQTSNEKGLVITSPILISTHDTGVAEVIIHVEFNGIEKQTGTSFHIW